MLLGNDLDNFHNFFHQLLVLWINHVVLSLMSQLVHIFLLTMLSFVSTSSLTVFVFPQVLRSQSDVAGVSLLVPKLHTRASSAPKLRIVRPMQSTNHRLASNCPGFTNSFSNSFDSSSRFVRLENHAEFGYLTPFDLTPDLWRSAFTGSIDSARSQTISAATATAETAENFPKILVCLLLTVGQFIGTFVTKHPSRCFPSFTLLLLLSSRLL